MKRIVTVTLERGKDGSYSAFISSDNCPFGCIGEGMTAKETEEDFFAGVEDMRRVYAKSGKPFPELAFRFKYDVPSFLGYYAYAFSLAGLQRITGINQRQLSHYVNGVRRPSKRTTQKIETALRRFATELSQITLL
jgi:hypothetical protein